jgi:ribose transport system ATP-binding protein
MITKLMFGKLFKVTKESELAESAAVWFEKLKIKCDGLKAPITDLSGGNQQKVLVARAMVADVDIIILDDPTRGVDVMTKRQIYSLLTELAEAGKLVIFYSSESLEMELCNRVEVMRYGTIVQELCGKDITSDSVVEASFTGEDLKKAGKDNEIKDSSKSAVSRFFRNPAFVPLIAMIAVYMLCGMKAKAVFSVYGIELLLKGSAPLIVLALGQMFIIGLGHVDLGAGYYMGFVNVICATILYTKPALGALVIIGSMLIYACMGLLIYYRNVPAVVITLGSSFIWSGVSLTIQSVPGGRVPSWLTNFFKIDTAVPMFVILILLITVLVIIFYRSKHSTVMKGFGNNPMALVRSGWSQPKAYFLIYLSSAVLITLAGLILSGLTGGSDINASGTYTMQTIAAVIVGGGHLLGGRVSVPGAVFGAVTFSIIASLLGFMKVSSELTAAVQGAILIMILALRIIKLRGVGHEEK